MKIIELLNKIANNEDVPKKIKVSCFEFEWRAGGRYYANTTKGNYQTLLQDWLNNANKLNSEVEIIEDEEEIDIQSIEEIKEVFIENSTCGEDVKFLARKYNQILQVAKQLDKNIKELR